MRHFFRTFSILCLPFSTSLFAETTEAPLSVKQDAPKSYVVVKGDTLWDISALYLDSPWLWPRLWQVNPEIDDPHLIYPGDKLSLIWRDGQPVLSLKPVVKLSPKIRVSEKKAVPTVEEGLVLPYLHSDRLVDQGTLDSASRVLGTSDGRKFLTSADQLFISGESGHQNWGIYRAVESYQRQNPKAKIISLRLIAKATLNGMSSDFTSLKVESQRQEILLNDVALPDLGIESVGFSTTFYPAPSPVGAFANILGSINGSQFSAKNQVLIIDRGTYDNLRQGSMFDLKAGGATVFKKQGEYTYDGSIGDKVELPDTEAGTLMVIRPYEFFSLALVTNSTKPINGDILAVSPLSKERVTPESP